MSASPMARQAYSQAQFIPTRKILINDASELPDQSLLSTTPGGTLYGTTPGGTRLIYERAFLKNLSKSPLSQTPPKDNIPACLIRGGNCNVPIKKLLKQQSPKSSPPKHDSRTDELFDMDL